MGKPETRERIRRRRRELDETALPVAADALAQHALTLMPTRPSIIACYLSMPSEPGTGPLVHALRSAGHTVVVPRIDGEDLRWIQLDDDTMYMDGPMGVSEPTGGTEIASLAWVDVVVLPALAVDRSGQRLGKGLGFYDRALAGVRRNDANGPLRIALLFDDEIIDDAHAEAHDAPVDVVVTPSGVLDVRTPERA